MKYRREDYPPTDALPWLDRPGAPEEIERRKQAGKLSEDDAAWLGKFERDGYIVFEGLVDAETCDAVARDTWQIYENNRHLPMGDELRLKFENVFGESPATLRALGHPALYEKVDLILGRRAKPHQTLNLPFSSQQGAHSDEILFTSHPAGFLVAAWFALEDITTDCGPLMVFPGSHRLPYISAKSIGIPDGATREECGRLYDENYYPRVRASIEEAGIEPFTFLAKKGDVLLWHSNLLHGAHFSTREGATRQSLIVHYYGEGAEFYSDLWQDPALDPELR